MTTFFSKFSQVQSESQPLLTNPTGGIQASSATHIEFPADCSCWVGLALLSQLVKEVVTRVRSKGQAPCRSVAPSGTIDPWSLVMILCHHYARGVYGSQEIAERLQISRQARGLPEDFNLSGEEIRQFRRQNHRLLKDTLCALIASILHWAHETGHHEASWDEIASIESHHRLNMAVLYDMADADE